MGSVPLWYRVLKAAQWMGVPPWELERQPLRYLHQVEEVSTMEALAHDARQVLTNPET